MSSTWDDILNGYAYSAGRLRAGSLPTEVQTEVWPTPFAARSVAGTAIELRRFPSGLFLGEVVGFYLITFNRSDEAWEWFASGGMTGKLAACPESQCNCG